jgi:hypothetical protein
MNELFSSQQYIEVDLYYKIEKTKSGQNFPIVITEEEYNKLRLDEKLKDKAKSLKTSWQMPTWKNANDLLHSATIYNYQKNDMDIDWNSYRDKRLKQYLVKWDAKDKDGQEIPCNEETINMLHQNIALALLKKYDEATQIDKETETKNF